LDVYWLVVILSDNEESVPKSKGLVAQLDPSMDLALSFADWVRMTRKLSEANRAFSGCHSEPL